MGADREIANQPYRHASPQRGVLRPRELIMRQPLQPRVEIDPGAAPRTLARDRGRLRVGQLTRPAPPIRAILLGEGTPRRPVTQRLTFTTAVPLECGLPRLAARHPVNELERGLFGRPDRVTVDELAARIADAQRGREPGDPYAFCRGKPRVLGHV